MWRGFCRVDCKHLGPNKYDDKILACHRITIGELVEFEKKKFLNCPFYER